MMPATNSRMNDWLMDGPTWVRYRTLVDLMGVSEEDEKVQLARHAMLNDMQIRALLKDISSWESYPLIRHNDATHPLHKLSFLSELGFNKNDAGISKIIDKIFNHQSAEGPFQIIVNIPTHFGGSGKDEWQWQLCDAPLLLYCLSKMGMGEDEKVQQGIDYLVGLVRENGWPCAAAPQLGKFHGPGRREDPCPYANLLMLKLLSIHQNTNTSHSASIGIETALELWQNSRLIHPYLFHMGKDFQKLKVPFIWYDILHVIEVLSCFPQTRQDGRFVEMLKIIQAKADPSGLFTPESIWTKWNGWEFTQKKEPSRWLTYTIARINDRISHHI